MRHRPFPSPWFLSLLLLGHLPGCGFDSSSSPASKPDVEPAELAPPQLTPSHAPTIPPPPIVSDPSRSEPVKAAMVCRQTNRTTAELLVAVRIAGGYYLHAEADHGGRFVPLAFEATLPEGVDFAGDWVSPSPEKGSGGIPIYRDTVLLRRPLKLISPSNELTVSGLLRYQACDEELCWPPGKLELTARLSPQPEVTR